jgi:hypothetical protein
MVYDQNYFNCSTLDAPGMNISTLYSKGVHVTILGTLENKTF